MSEKNFVRICSKKDIPDGEARGFKVNGMDIAVACSEGHYFAIGDVCTHEQEHLHEGWLEGDRIECPRHGAQFSLKTGEALSLPATEPVQVFEIKIEGDDILAAIPDS